MIQFELKANEYSPLVLAYIGDAVYELYIRSRLSERANIPPSALHKMSTHYVCAKAQNTAFHVIEEILSQEELAVMKRGRNAKSATSPKNADITHYRHATGVEALIGFLYIKGEHARIDELMNVIFDALEENDSDKQSE